MLNLMRVIIPQQGLNENNIENTQVNVLDISIDYDLLLHLIDNDDDDQLQSSTTQFRGMGMEKNTTTVSTEATWYCEYCYILLKSWHVHVDALTHLLGNAR
ncbi:hypothetical protein GBA52_024742 [Prunus armeniaca]|nr:hypothetical protein GBA52_024742 [Prunus armeniaca]